MAKLPAYRLTGTVQAGQTTTSFRVLVRRDGDFSGSLDVAVPHSPVFRSDVIAVGANVYVRSPTELQELGITTLPGNLNPSTTWVLQPPSVARSYRHSLAPFVSSGLAATLAGTLKGTLSVRRSRLDGNLAVVVEEAGGRSSLRLFVQPAHDHLLELAITGDQPVFLHYSGFGVSQPVKPPPSSLVYVPPTPAASG
jgi:hypothetical protein